MADDFAVTLFTETRADHAAARRWFVIVLAALAVFHLLIFRPYVTLTGKRAAARDGLAHQTVLKQELDAMTPELAHLAELSSGEAKRRLDDLLADLKRSFLSLNAALADLRRMRPDEAAGEPGEELFVPVEPASLAVQGPIANAMAQTAPAAAAAASPPDVPVMDAATRRAVATSGSLPEVLQAIKAYVNEQMIAPRFQRFNESWRQEVMPAVGTAAGALQQRIKAAAGRYPGEAASWSGAEQAVAAVVAAVDRFAIAPPADALWWRASETKDAQMESFLSMLGASPIERAPALAELTQRTQAAIADNQRQQTEIAGQMAQLDEEFHEQQKELADLVGPLKGIAIDLGTVVPYFPAILAIAFVALIGWLASRIEELGEAAAMVARADPASTAPEWLRRRISESPWHRRIVILARGIALLAWVALASSELAGAALVGRAEALLLVLAAAIGLAGASRYEWRVVRRLRLEGVT